MYSSTRCRGILYISVLSILFFHLPSQSHSAQLEDVWPYDITCDPLIGTSAPLPECSEEDPCDERLFAAIYNKVGITSITSREFLVSECAGNRLFKWGEYRDDGPPVAISVPSASGGENTRHYCFYGGPDNDPPSRKPLLLYVPPSGGNASQVYKTAGYRIKAETYGLDNSYGNGQETGYVFVSVQPRNLHWPSSLPQDGTKSDFMHRDWDNNADVLFLDTLIDKLVDDGLVDPERIFLSGWSNGAYFSHMYSIVRSKGKRSTPGGNKVAAVATYSGADPFGPVYGDNDCQLAEYPKASNLPIMTVSRDCDLVSCPDVAQWIDDLGGKVKNKNHPWIILDKNGNVVDTCKEPCGLIQSVANHNSWPPEEVENEMLEFLRNGVCVNPRKVKDVSSEHNKDGIHISFTRRAEAECVKIEAREKGTKEWKKLSKCYEGVSPYELSKSKLKGKLGGEFPGGGYESMLLQISVRAVDTTPTTGECGSLKSDRVKVISTPL